MKNKIKVIITSQELGKVNVVVYLNDTQLHSWANATRQDIMFELEIVKISVGMAGKDYELEIIDDDTLSGNCKMCFGAGKIQSVDFGDVPCPDCLTKENEQLRILVSDLEKWVMKLVKLTQD